MAKQGRSELRRQRAHRVPQSHPTAPLLLDLPRTALGTTERVPTDGERFLAEHPELERPVLSPYNPYAWLDPARSPARATLAQGEMRGWLRWGLIVVLLVMLAGAIGGVAQMVGAVTARGGLWGEGFLSGLLFCSLFGALVFAFAHRLLRPDARR